MELLKRILKQPIRETLIILGIAFAVFIILALVKGYFDAVTVRETTLRMHQDPIKLLRFASQIALRDFIFISKIIFELALLVLVAQIIYRFKGRLKLGDRLKLNDWDVE